MSRRKQPSIPDELLDQLLGGADPRAALAERVLNAELDHHLDGGEPDGPHFGCSGISVPAAASRAPRARSSVKRPKR